MAKTADTKNNKDQPQKKKPTTVGDLVLRKTKAGVGKKSEQTVKAFDTSKFLPLREALEKTRLVGEMLNSYPTFNSTFLQMAEMQKQLMEPLQRLAEPVRQINEHVEKLNKMGIFNLPSRLFPAIESLPKLTIPELPKMDDMGAELDEPYLIHSPSPMVVLRNQVSELEAKLEDMGEQVKQAVTEQFDNFAKQVNIPLGFKNAHCQCKFCGNVLVKFEGVFFFTQGTMKCGSCGKMLQLPRDMKITAT